MNVKVLVPTTIELKPGDKVRLEQAYYTPDGWKNAVATIDRLVETKHRTYAIFNHPWAWRPLSTYGKTWIKVEDE